MTTKGLYLHIPYCVRKCSYCDFCSVGRGFVPDEYIVSLIKEAERYSREAKIPVDTLYFGGGTPSLLEGRQLEKIMRGIDDVFSLSSLSEITLEANPGTLTKEKLWDYKSLGVNRISLGLQSIHENEMKILGRIHSFADFLDSYESVRACGIGNVSVDLMYGIPEQTMGSFEATLRTVVSLRPEHVSSYGLILEEGTPLYRDRERLSLPTEDEECDMYSLACELLRSEGYSHYEISNYARDGYESRHNLKYWRDEEYIGLGAAAYSYFGGKRYGNVRDTDAYIRGDGLCIDSEDVDPTGERYEYAMMRLRLREGFSLSDYKRRFSSDFLDGKGELIRKYSDVGLLKIDGDRISFTEKGFYVSNSLLTELL